MAQSTSRARPEGGFWYTATLPASGMQDAKMQEFYISNNELQASCLPCHPLASLNPKIALIPRVNSSCPDQKSHQKLLALENAYCNEVLLDCQILL